jgi:hypothetical protein
VTESTLSITYIHTYTHTHTTHTHKDTQKQTPHTISTRHIAAINRSSNNQECSHHGSTPAAPPPHGPDQKPRFRSIHRATHLRSSRRSSISLYHLLHAPSLYLISLHFSCPDRRPYRLFLRPSSSPSCFPLSLQRTPIDDHAS